MRRSGGKPTDILCVSGDLGGAYLGLQVLEREKQAYLADPETQPELESYNYVMQRQLKPEARLDIVHELRELGVHPTSMIDISDGLLSDLGHVAARSGVAVDISPPPMDPTLADAAGLLGVDPMQWVLTGGEDHAMVATFPPDVKLPARWTVIGEVLNPSALPQVTVDGAPWTSKSGWDHFGGIES